MSTLRVGIPVRVSLVPVPTVLVGSRRALAVVVRSRHPARRARSLPYRPLPPASAAVDSSPMGRLSSRPFGQTTNPFTLSNGSFTVTTAPNGDSFSGVYTGLVSVSTTLRSTASLDLDVTSGTGGFLGAQGSLSGSGSGAFSGEGAFSLGLDGFIATAADRRFHVKVDVTGTSSVLSCSSQGLSLTLHGDGVAAKVGNVQTLFTHLVGNTHCGP